MKCYRKYGSDVQAVAVRVHQERPSMKCYRKNGSDGSWSLRCVLAMNPQ